MKLVIDQPLYVANWVAEHIPSMHGQPFSGVSWAIGIQNDDIEPIGGVVFTNHVPAYRNVEISFAATSRRWLTRPIITAIMRYPFETLDCQRVTSITPKKNAEARAFIDRFGFAREASIWKGFGNDDAIISRLKRRDWQHSRFNTERVQAQL